MQLNGGKCRLLVFGSQETEFSIKTGPSVIKESKQEKLLGAETDQWLNFNQNLNIMCTKASQEIHALARAST